MKKTIILFSIVILGVLLFFRRDIQHDPRFKLIAWADLLPKQDLEALLNPPSYITEVEEGSSEDQISSFSQGTFVSSSDPFQRALTSTRVLPEWNNQAIRLAGFMVPVEYNDQKLVTQFFLVPYFGACLHAPPPPPNQTILVNYPNGIKVESIQSPFWVSGILNCTLTRNYMAFSAYSLDMEHCVPYR